MPGSAAHAAPTTRRTMLLSVSAALAAAACTDAPHRIQLGTGLPGGLFHDFGANLAAAAARSPAIRITPVPTAGSVRNLELLDRSVIDAALTLGDTAVALGTPALAVGRLYETYLHLAVRMDSRFRHLTDLRGSRVDLGVAGSGSAFTAERLFRTAGLLPGTDITVSHRELTDALPALHSGVIDAVVWGAGVPTPGIGTPAFVRLLELADWVEQMSDRFGYSYDRAPVPTDTYPGNAAFDTVGVPVLLLVSPALDGRTVEALAEILLHHSSALVPERMRGFQFFDRRWLVSTGDIPLHPAAAGYYRRQHG